MINTPKELMLDLLAASPIVSDFEFKHGHSETTEQEAMAMAIGYVVGNRDCSPLSYVDRINVYTLMMLAGANAYAIINHGLDYELDIDPEVIDKWDEYLDSTLTSFYQSYISSL